MAESSFCLTPRLGLGTYLVFGLPSLHQLLRVDRACLPAGKRPASLRFPAMDPVRHREQGVSRDEDQTTMLHSAQCPAPPVKPDPRPGVRFLIHL
ncbi:hypothetical protein MRX96_055162 [Rhipicephalus microplus]